jgi:uncharacterized phage protein gp47/JayE
MADLPTRLELVQRWRDAALATPGTRISAREIDREGSDLNLLANAMGLLGELVVSRVADQLAGLFEDTAENDRLDRLIFDRKGEPRKPATPSVVRLALTRPTADAGAGIIIGGPYNSDPDPTRIRTNRGIVYFLLEPATFGVGELGPVLVDAQASLAGADQNVDETAAFAWVDEPFDPSIAVSVVGLSAGGANEESDTEYRARSKQFFPSLQKGTLGAIEYGARRAPGIAAATTIEPTDADGVPVGAVDVYVLDQAGRSNETLAARAQLALLGYRAGGIPAIVRTSLVEQVPVRFGPGIAWDVRVVSNTAEGKRLVRARVTAALRNQRPSQTLLRSTIIAAARTVPGFLFEDSDLLEPSATLVPPQNTALQTSEELVDFEG